MAVLLLVSSTQTVSDENNSCIFRVTFKWWPVILLLIPIPSQKKKNTSLCSSQAFILCFHPLSLHFILFLYLQSFKLPFFFTAPWSFPVFTVPPRFAIHLCADLHFVQKLRMKLLLMKIRWLPWQSTKKL